MDIKVENMALNKTHVDKRAFSKMSDLISTGNAILFAGAGFNYKAENILGEMPPCGEKLSYKICELGGFEPDRDLKYASDFYLANYDRKKLINFLKDIFTINKVKKYHKTIVSKNWRRIYTTNYDNLIDLAGLKVSKRVTAITIDDSPDDYLNDSNLCIHLNGNLKILNEDSLNTKFKLSDSSYCSPDSFVSSAWNYVFQKDLERCSAIIFVGYSLYDIEIKKLLHNCEKFKQKAFFIIKGNPSQKEQFEVSKYGTTFPIGIGKFASALENIRVNDPNTDQFYLETFSEFAPSSDSMNIRDSDIYHFLMQGELKDCYYQQAANGVQSLPFLVNRKIADEIVDHILDKKNILIYSGLGNGKTVLSKIIAAKLILRGVKCYLLNDEHGEWEKDLDKISQQKSPTVLILDGYIANHDFFKYFKMIKPDNITLLLTTRVSELEWYEKALKEIPTHRFNISQIEFDEIAEFVDIINNAALWDKMTALSFTRKRDIIKNRYKSQFSQTLLNLLKSPKIKVKFEDIVKKVSSKDEYKKTILVIAICQVWQIRHDRALIATISRSDLIYSSEFAENLYIKELLSSELCFCSSVFALFVLKNYFSPIYIVDQLLEIAEILNNEKSVGNIRKFFQDILRFGKIEKILSENNKKNALVKHYEQLKNRLTWLQRESHFWMQYGMAQIPYKNYNTAQRYFNTAYDIARRIEGYDTSYIDTQQARLYMKQAVASSEDVDGMKYFEKAHKLLSTLDIGEHVLRQLKYYHRFYDTHYSSLSKGMKTRFNGYCVYIKNKIESCDNFDGSSLYTDILQKLENISNTCKIKKQ